METDRATAGKLKNHVLKPILAIFMTYMETRLKNRKNWGFLRFSNVWDSYDQCEDPIPDIPDARQFLRRDRKNRKHFYFEGTSQTVPDVSDFYDECEHEICLSGTGADDRGFYDWCEHEICLSGTSGMLDFVFTCYQSLIFSKL